jgi:hypothetical protein
MLARRWPSTAAQCIAPLPFVAVCVADETQYVPDVRMPLRCAIAPGKLGVWCQRIVLVQVPHFFGVRQSACAGHEALEKVVQVVDVAKEQLSRVVIVSGIDGLWKIDDHRAVGAEQDVVIREIAVHHADAQHPNDFANQAFIDDSCRLGLEGKITQARGRGAVRADDQFHDEYAIDEIVWVGHAHAASVQAVNHVDFGGAPGRLFLLASVPGAFCHCPLVSRISHLAAFGVRSAMLEGAILCFLVHLRNAESVARRNKVDLRFFAAHQGAEHFGDDSLVVQRGEAIGNTHGETPGTLLDLERDERDLEQIRVPRVDLAGIAAKGGEQECRQALWSPSQPRMRAAAGHASRSRLTRGELTVADLLVRAVRQRFAPLIGPSCPLRQLVWFSRGRAGTRYG